MAEQTTVSLTDIQLFKQKALHWANQFRVVCLLDSNNYPHTKYRSKDWVLAIDALEEIRCGKNAFEEMGRFQRKVNSNIFGFFSYDLKNQIENLSSKNHDGIKFPELYFFKPRYILEISGSKLTVNRNYPETYELIERIKRITDCKKQTPNKLSIKCRTDKKEYLQRVNSIRKQIEEGDFYELNYCVEFFSEHADLKPAEVFLGLNEKSKAPFSCFLKLNHKYLLCASPERFLKKERCKLVAQPIKGTIRKGKSKQENEKLKTQLQFDVKERAENVMIVDLVRNDLAKSSKKGSVNVEELFGLYEFNTVNQMISTITSETNTENVAEIISHAFPMGSMTGAPKIEVMKNIERYENFKRGLFSGSVGYITPENDFDFNVVIRSILYNSEKKYISIPAGGAITYDSVPEKEWDEILLKAKGVMEVLNADLTTSTS